MRTVVGGVWTRFLPLSAQVRERVSSGAFGTAYRVLGRLQTIRSMPFHLCTLAKLPGPLLSSARKANTTFNRNRADGHLDFADDHRMVNLGLAGGAMLLDLAIYALTWLMQVPYHVQPEQEK
jgi:hypothetical protein